MQNKNKKAISILLIILIVVSVVSWFWFDTGKFYLIDIKKAEVKLSKVENEFGFKIEKNHKGLDYAAYTIKSSKSANEIEFVLHNKRFITGIAVTLISNQHKELEKCVFQDEEIKLFLWLCNEFPYREPTEYQDYRRLNQGLMEKAKYNSNEFKEDILAEEKVEIDKRGNWGRYVEYRSVVDSGVMKYMVTYGFYGNL